MNDFYEIVTVPISKGFVKGGYAELKKQYPKRLRTIEKELRENPTPEGMEKYRDNLINGLRKIGYWND